MEDIDVSLLLANTQASRRAQEVVDAGNMQARSRSREEAQTARARGGEARQAREVAEIQALSQAREEILRKLASNTASPDPHAWGTHQQAVEAILRFRNGRCAGFSSDVKRELGCRSLSI